MKASIQPGQPILLLAVPQLLDSNFQRSVVLVIEHNPEGAMGLVLNQPSSTNLEAFSLSQKLFCNPELAKISVFKGGPLEPERGWILHRGIQLAEKKEILPNFYLSISQQSLRALLDQGKPPLQFFLGYAGWGEGQLEQEMIAGGWLVTPVPSDLLEIQPTQLWDILLERMGVNPNQLATASGVH